MYILSYCLYVDSLRFFWRVICWGFFYDQNPPMAQAFGLCRNCTLKQADEHPKMFGPKSFVMASNGLFSHFGFEVLLRVFFWHLKMLEGYF